MNASLHKCISTILQKKLRIFYILSAPEFDINIIQQKAKSYSSEEEDRITF